MDRDTLLRRAAKLAALADDRTSIAEAEAAAEALARLLAAHRLTMEEVSAAGFKERIRAERKSTAFVRIPRWAQYLAAGIAAACDCTTYSSHRRDAGLTSVTVLFIGEAADAAVAGYWYEVMERTLPAIAARSKDLVVSAHHAYRQAMAARGVSVKRCAWTTLRDDFLVSAADRICKRLAQRLAPPQGEQGDPGRALVVMKQAAITQWIAEQYAGVEIAGASAMRQTVDPSARLAGARAGDALPLADGIRAADPLAALPLVRA